MGVCDVADVTDWFDGYPQSSNAHKLSPTGLDGEKDGGSCDRPRLFGQFLLDHRGKQNNK